MSSDLPSVIHFSISYSLPARHNPRSSFASFASPLRSLVDDDFQQLELRALVLKMSGFTVLTAARSGNRRVWVRGFARRDGNGKITRLGGTALDITALKRAEDQVAANLARANSALGGGGGPAQGHAVNLRSVSTSLSCWPTG
jgi:hypothetical protein